MNTFPEDFRYRFSEAEKREFTVLAARWVAEIQTTDRDAIVRDLQDAAMRQPSLAGRLALEEAVSVVRRQL